LIAGERLRHARLSNFETELQQFAMDTWSVPERIVDAHPPDQRAPVRLDFLADRLPIGTSN